VLHSIRGLSLLDLGQRSVCRGVQEPPPRELLAAVADLERHSPILKVLIWIRVCQSPADGLFLSLLAQHKSLPARPQTPGIPPSHGG
jgi:hypothetical protein